MVIILQLQLAGILKQCHGGVALVRQLSREDTMRNVS